jgi:predicted site-specific integrase-resolvase
MDEEQSKVDQRVFVPVREAARLTGLNCQTIRKLADSASLICFRTPSNQRRINLQSIRDMCKTAVPVTHREGGSRTKENFIYARVSTKKQMDDLSRQVDFIKQYDGSCYSGYRVVTDIASGINFKRKGLQTLLDACLQGRVGEVIVAHRDRLCRFGFELFDCLVSKAGGKITVLDHQEHRTCEQELSDDLLSIIHVFSCRQMGKRSYSSRKAKNSKSEDLPNPATEETT